MKIDGKSVDRIHPAYREGEADWKAQLNMLLPDGINCGECIHSLRCKTIFDGDDKNTFCQFHPNRFRQRGSAI